MPRFDIESFRNYDCISFDVYDTLVTRPYVRPVDLFAHVERLLGAKGFAEARINAEREARRIHCREITLNEIYGVLDAKYAGCKEKEIELEITVPFPTEDAKEITEKLLEMGKKVVIISDMYLSRDTIKTMLDRIGIRFTSLYVSSEFGFSKHDGRLFAHVLKEMNIDPKKMIHVGDNRHADYNVPRSFGIDAVLCEKPIDAYRKKHRKEYRFYTKKKTLERSMMIGMDMLRPKGDVWYEMGYRFGGPLATSFTIYANSHVDDGMVLYISRDGYNLKRIGDILYPERKSGYAYAQRLLLDVLTDYKIPFEPLRVPTGMTRKILNPNYEANTILKFFNMDAKPDVLSSYNSNVEMLTEMRKEGFKSYRRYIRDICGDENVHLIDCTTMKFSSQRLVEKALGKQVKGHYFVTLENGEFKHDTMCFWKTPIIGWMNVNIPEFFLCSTEYPLCGWNDGPVFDENDEYEKFRISHYGDVSNGEVDYAKKYSETFGKNVIPFDYYSIVGWSKLSAAHGGKYRRELKKIMWASNPDHSDYSPLIANIRYVIPFVKRVAIGILARIVWR